MAKRKRALTLDKIEERIRHGWGQGHGAQYKPWLRIQDVPSRGLVIRLKGWKTGRQHDLLSKLEKSYFYLLDWSSQVVDIREQKPLLPLEATLQIAKDLGVKHPTDPKRQQPIVLTTDFLVTCRRDDGEVELARTLKYAHDLQSRRTLEKLEIERLYWQLRQVDWGIVTERDIPTVTVKNLELLRSLDIDEALNPSDLVDIAHALTRLVQQGTGLSRAAALCDRKLGLERGTSLAAAYHLMALRYWQVDFSKPIQSGQPLGLLGVNPHVLQAQQ